MRAKSHLVLVLISVLMFIAQRPVFGQNPKQQLNALVRETQKQGSRPGRITLVWWIPSEFWRVAMRSSGAIPVDKIEEMVSAVSDINVFLIIDAKVGPLATMESVPTAELQKNFSVFDTSGKPLAPIPEAKQSAAAKNLLAVMKPLVANMLGEFGKGISFFVYEGKNRDGSRRIDPLKPGTFTAKLNEEEFRWRLPIGSLMPDKICPKCHEQFPGNYAFCPFDATPLQVVQQKKSD